MLLIIHGWSDDYRSFKKLGKFLADEGLSDPVRHIHLGNYISMDDEVTFDDLCAALKAAWEKESLPTAPRSVDIVVHSTAGLIVRDWMTRNYNPDTNPVHRLLMLAPANFGSPLAHKGKSFMGRIIKGFGSKKMFQTGARILDGLELASSYSWELALKDRFGDQDWYGPGKVLATVLVGNSGYSGIAAAANENGSDGTVRVSTANLNAEMLKFDFATQPEAPSISVVQKKGKIAFARINKENHSTIAFKDRGPKSNITSNMILDALKIDDAVFPLHCQALERFSIKEREIAEKIRGYDDRKFKRGFQHTVIHLSDDFDFDVDDYFIELFAKKAGSNKPDNLLTQKIQHRVISKAHSFKNNKSYRSLLIDTVELKKLLVEKKRDLFISLTAMPEVDDNGNVGYSTLSYNAIGSIIIKWEDIPKLFQPDRTILLDIKIKRHQKPHVFEFKAL